MESSLQRFYIYMFLLQSLEAEKILQRNVRKVALQQQRSYHVKPKRLYGWESSFYRELVGKALERESLVVYYDQSTM